MGIAAQVLTTLKSNPGEGFTTELLAAVCCVTKSQVRNALNSLKAQGEPIARVHRGTYAYDGEGTLEGRYKTIPDAVVTFLKNHPEGVTPEQLARHMLVDVSYIHQLLYYVRKERGVKTRVQTIIQLEG